MLGTEYNWLITVDRQGNGLPRVSLGGSGLITLAVAVFCFLCVSLRAAPTPSLADEAAWGVADMDGIIEGLALHPVTNEAFFSDVHNRCIWTRDPNGSHAVMKKFSAESDGLLGVFALKIDHEGRTLWASSSALPEMNGYTAADQGRAFLAAYDLTTRKLRRTCALPADGRKHLLGDFTIDHTGAIYATDTFAPVIWWLPAGADRLEKWLEFADFKSLQGIALSADQRSLYVADYSKGIWRIDLATRAAVLLAAPAGAELRGLDGLYTVPGGLVAVQNGTKTQRILRIDLDESGVLVRSRVLFSGHPAMTDLSLGQVVQGRLHFIADSGWLLYANPTATPAPRRVTILSTPTG
jgi:sugar lactone lactonase YvrE